MPKTNKERLQDNNIELQNIKTGIDNLPDNPGIEPIYATKSDFIIYNTKINCTTFLYTNVSYIDNYAIIWQNSGSSSNKSTFTIVRINDANSVDVLYTQEQPIRTYGANIITIKDDILYYTAPVNENTTSTLYMYALDLKTNTNSLYSTFNTYDSTSFNSGVFSSNGELEMVFDTVTLKLDIVNKTSTKLYNNSYNLFFNDNFISTNDRKAILKRDNNYTKTFSGTVNFVNIGGNKIIINNSLYYLEDSLELGDKIKDMTSNDNYIANSFIMSLGTDLYMMMEKTGPNSYSHYKGYICRFNEDENYFENIYEVDSPRLQYANYYGGKYVSFLNNQNEICYITTSRDLEKIIGYSVYGRKFYFSQPVSVNTDKVIDGYVVYNNSLVGVQGTMPNNGALNYTPTTSQQTIPAGYTSGGTVGAVTSSIDSNIQAENIKKDVSILRSNRNIRWWNKYNKWYSRWSYFNINRTRNKLREEKSKCLI